MTEIGLWSVRGNLLPTMTPDNFIHDLALAWLHPFKCHWCFKSQVVRYNDSWVIIRGARTISCFYSLKSCLFIPLITFFIEKIQLQNWISILLKRWGVHLAHIETVALQLGPSTWHIIALSMFRRQEEKLLHLKSCERETLMSTNPSKNNVATS